MCIYKKKYLNITLRPISSYISVFVYSLLTYIKSSLNDKKIFVTSFSFRYSCQKFIFLDIFSLKVLTFTLRHTLTKVHLDRETVVFLETEILVELIDIKFLSNLLVYMLHSSLLLNSSFGIEVCKIDDTL